MRRRDFITVLGTTAAAWPLGARAQQRLPVVGFLSGAQPELFTPSSPFGVAFRDGLTQVGSAEGKNFKFEGRWAGGQFDRLPALATELLAGGTAVIVTNTLPAALAAKAATELSSCGLRHR